MSPPATPPGEGPSTPMYLRCPDCKTRYEISAARIPDGGARVRCPRCRTVFHVSRPLNGNGAEAAFEDDLRDAPNGAAAGATAVESGAAPDSLGTSAHAAVSGEGGASEAAASREETPAPEESPAPTHPPAPTHHPAPTQTESLEETPAWAGTAPPGEAPARNDTPTPDFAYAPCLSPEVIDAAPAPPASRVPPARPVVVGAVVDSVTARRIARAILSDLASARVEQRHTALREGRVLSTLGPVIVEAWDDYRRRVGPALALGTPHFREALNEFLGNGEPLL